MVTSERRSDDTQEQNAEAVQPSTERDHGSSRKQLRLDHKRTEDQLVQVNVRDWHPSEGSRWYINDRPATIQHQFNTGTLVVHFDGEQFTKYFQANDSVDYMPCLKTAVELSQERANALIAELYARMDAEEE